MGNRTGFFTKARIIYTILLIVSIAAIIIGYLLEHGGNGLAGHIVNELGISGLIGFILAITVEHLSAEEFRKLAQQEGDKIKGLIKKDVFYYVFGHYIPETIRQEINEHILQSFFIRENLIMEYELEVIEAPDSHEKYLLTLGRMVYDLRNLTTEPRAFKLQATVDNSPNHRLADKTKFISLSVKGCQKPFEWDDQTLREKTTQNETEIALGLPSEIVVLPGEDKLTTIDIQSQTVRFLSGGHIDFVFTTHTCDLDLTVRIRDRSLKVSASAYSHNELKEANRHNPAAGHYHWKLEKPLLAYQGIHISWTPQQAAGSEKPVTAVTQITGPEAAHMPEAAPTATN